MHLQFPVFFLINSSHPKSEPTRAGAISYSHENRGLLWLCSQIGKHRFFHFKTQRPRWIILLWVKICKILFFFSANGIKALNGEGGKAFNDFFISKTKYLSCVIQHFLMFFIHLLLLGRWCFLLCSWFSHLIPVRVIAVICSLPDSLLCPHPS